MALRAVNSAIAPSRPQVASRAPTAGRAAAVVARASARDEPARGALQQLDASRRAVLVAGGAAAAALASPPIANAAKEQAQQQHAQQQQRAQQQHAQQQQHSSGFVNVEDLSDGYSFNYPFGWQELSIKGADVVFKDVVEPLESVSVTMVKTNKKDISEYGSLDEVSETLAKSVLTAPGTTVKILNTSERTDDKGHRYYEIEFSADKPSRHQLAVVAVAQEKLFTLTIGCSERRWGKMGDRLKGTVKSFNLLF